MRNESNNSKAEAAKTATSLFEEENPNASSEYKDVVRRLAQLLVESTEEGWDGEEPLTKGEVLQDTLEQTLDTHADLQTAVHDVVRGNTPRQTLSEWVADVCRDGQDAAEAEGDFSSAAAWQNASYGLDEAL